MSKKMEAKEVCRDCHIAGGEDCVTLCPLHAADAELLAALKAVLPPNGDKGVGEWWGLSESEQHERISAVIAKAEGK